MNTHLNARRAAIAGTREMIRQDEFAALVTALVECEAVPRDTMSKALARLADGMIAKARGELETEWTVYPAELFDRAREIDAIAAGISR